MKRKILSLLVGVFLVGSLVAGPLVMEARAGTIQNAYMFLNDMGTGQTSGFEFILAVAPATDLAATGTTLTIQFPDGDDGLWCRSGGSLSVSGVSSSPVDPTSGAITASLPGSLSASCTAGSGGSSYDTITVSGIGDTDNTNTYGVQISGSTGVLGTASSSPIVTLTLDDTSNTDNMAFEVNLVDGSVAVTTDVSSAPTVTCSLSSNSVDIPDLIQGGSFQTASHTITASTSSGAAGYYWAAFGTGDGSTDAGLYTTSGSTYLIESTGSGTVDLNSAEGFGITVSDPNTGGAETVATDFQDGTTGQFGALNIGYSGAQLLLSQELAETSGDTATVTYGARAGLSAEITTGDAYDETVEFICGGYY